MEAHDRHIARLNAQLDGVPEEPGVYLMRDRDGHVLYVGKAINLRQRLRHYFTPHPDVDRRIAAMIDKIDTFETILCANELEALILESNLIKRYRSPYNILMRDDKEYPYIRVTMNEPFPRVMKAFHVGPDVEEGARYYGPWLAGDIHRALKALGTMFPLRRCSLDLPRQIGQSRPCLYHDMGLCLAPCSGNVDEATYRAMAEEVCDFLEGRTDDLIDRFERDMHRAADDLEFERAASLREKWMALKRLREGQRVVDQKGGDRDALAIARNGFEVALARLEVRDGRVTGCSHIFTDDMGGDDADYLSSLMREQYSAAWKVPREVLVASPLDDHDLMASFLASYRDGAVRLHRPQRGAKRALVEMAEKNAKNALWRRARTRGADPLAIEANLMSLADHMGLDFLPTRIEAYDISHFGEGDRVASMVVFVNGKRERASYRHFKIKGFEGIDDYRAMREVIARRLNHLDDKAFGLPPDVILVDGGVGHVSAVRDLTDGAGIPVAGMVKDARHRTRGLVTSSGKTVELSKPPPVEDDEARAARLGLLHLLTSIQDEAHRFARRHLEKRHHKRATRYTLEQIDGVGPARRKRLLRTFKTSKGVSEASLADLLNVEGLPEDVAHRVYEHFHPQAEEAIE
ncbi:MAG: excinuclease ABC subunit UvrC [Saccharofermentanales bacterium]|jgi:excinuclease ABC subunit C